MNWLETHLAQINYILNFLGQMLPAVLTVAVIFTFFLVHSFSKKLSRMSYFLDRIDNHLREITFLMKEAEKRAVNGDPKRGGTKDDDSGD